MLKKRKRGLIQGPLQGTLRGPVRGPVRGLLWNPSRWTRWGLVLGVGLYASSVATAGQGREAQRAPWFPDASRVTHFSWSGEPCDECKTVTVRPEWQRMVDLAGLEEVQFLQSRDRGLGPAWSYAPGTIVLSSATLSLPRCQLAFVIGHELVHIAQRHFDEDAHAVSILSGKSSSWTEAGEEAMELLDGDFPLALRMSPMWHQQEQEADWVGSLLAAQAAGCGLEQGALKFLGVDEDSGGGVISAHDESQERVHFLKAFTESAKRLAQSSR